MVAKVLEHPTLVLNRNWQPVNVATVARALVLLWNESARVVDPARLPALHLGRLVAAAPERRRRFIQAVRMRLRVPEVIVLADYDRLPTAAVGFSRRNIFKRDHWTCQYCGCQPGGEELTIDHVLPRSQGGTSTWENCVLACIGCNKRKADRTPHQARHEAPQGCRSGRRGSRSTPGQRADRKLVEVHQRGVLERPAGEVTELSPRGLFPWALHECAPGRASGLQNRPTGFDSSRSCLHCRRGSTEKGTCLVNRMMLVRIQSSALV